MRLPDLLKRGRYAAQLVVGGLLALAAFSIPAVAQDAQQGDGKNDAVVVFGYSPGEQQCTVENTRNVAFSDLLSGAARYRDGCVSTVAWLSGRALFLDREDLSLEHSNSNEDAEDRRVGLYGADSIMESLWQSGTMQVRVIGVLKDCDDLYRPNVIMVLGYCHYTGGPFIGVASFHPLP